MTYKLPKLESLKEIFSKLSDDEAENLFEMPIFNNPILKLQKNISDKSMDSVYLFVIFEFILGHHELSNGKGIRLTGNGWLNMNFCKEIYEVSNLKDKMIESGISKKIDEPSIKFIETLHDIVIMTGITRKIKNHLVITKKGKEINSLNRQEKLSFFLSSLLETYDWSHFDGFTSNIAGQMGLLWIFLILKIHGKKKCEVGYYLALYQMMFPTLVHSSHNSDFFTPEQDFEFAFKNRLFDCILSWLNLVEIRKEKFSTELSDQIETTSTFESLMDWNNCKLNIK